MSNIFTLNWADLGKSILLTFLTSLVTAVYQIIQLGDFPTWEQLLVNIKVAGLAALAYLIKNLLTNDSGEFMKPNRDA